jgi:signal transduction histidine kinase/DNA-binding response OmpR family regulator/ligand-binding sensor domain-containing protein
MQDHLGFIWIGAVGIYKYDGYTFTHYKELPGCSNCAPSNNYSINSMVEDRLGIIWVLSVNGIKLFDPEKERTLSLVPFQISDTSFITLGQGKEIIIDSAGNIWTSGITGLIKISCEEKYRTVIDKDMLFNSKPDTIFSIETFNISNDTNSNKNRVKTIYLDGNRNIWIGCREGLYLLKKGEKAFFRLDLDPGGKSRLISASVNSIMQESDDIFWIATSNGLSRISNVRNAIFEKTDPEISTLDFTDFLKDSGVTLSLLKDRNKNLLVGTGTDLYRVIKDENSGTFSFQSLYQSITDPSYYGHDINVVRIMQDRTGVLWAGHGFHGILKFSLERSNFKSFDRLIAQKFGNNEVSQIVEDRQGNLWIGTYGGGLLKIQQDNYGVTQYDPGPSRNLVTCLLQVAPDVFWIGPGRGIIEYNNLNGKFSDPFQLASTRAAGNLKNTFVTSFLKDENSIYITSGSGLFVYDMKSGKLLQVTIDKNDSIPQMTNYFYDLLKAEDGNIWTTSFKKGICKIEYNPGDGIFLLHPFESKTLSVNNLIDCPNTSFYQDRKGIFWVGNGYLQKVNIKTGEIRSFKLLDNIDFPFVQSILGDDHDNLWLGTYYGLCRFNKITEEVKNFTTEDGIPIFVHNLHSAFKNKEGEMYFGGLGGFYSFHPDSIRANNSIPPVVVTDFSLFNKQLKVDSSGKGILSKNISYTQSLILKHNQNDISFKFAVLDYNQPLKNKYAYRLEGYQDKWIMTDSKNRTAAFTNLDPGTYTFRVKGSNNDNVWNEEGTSISIIILKPWWSTAFARGFFILFFIIVLGVFIRWRIWQLKKDKTELGNLVKIRTQQVEKQKDLLEVQNQKITELDHLKNRFFTNISHEFRTPLSLIQGPVEELLDNPRRSGKELGKLNMIYRNERRLLNLVNQLLDISKIDSSKMKLEITKSNIMKYLRAIAASFNSQAETRDISYKYLFAVDEKITWFDPDKCEKIVSNLLSNAFKFTPKGGIVLFRADYILNSGTFPLTIQLTVEDNGSGIPEESLEKIFDRFYQVEESVRNAAGGTGIGLSLAREMARLMHGDITVTSRPGKGSIFSVHFPLGREHLGTDEFTVLNELPEYVSIARLQNDDVSLLKEQEEGSEHRKPVILLVEDNIDIRVQLADNFQSKYTIRHASDGVVGLKKAIEIIPDLIITDLMMPFMDGLEMCTRLKNDERTSHIPVIMLTAKVTVEDKISGLQTGADDYVSKPFHLTELKARVDNLIDQRRKLRERFSREISIQLSDITVTPLDEKFLRKAVIHVEQHLNDPHFDLPEFRDEMNMSSSTLFRKLHALTNQSPTEFIRTLRLKRAASLLSQNFGNITQVSLEVGFNNLSYFNKSFRKLFGVSPGEYMKSHQIK